MNFSKNYCGTNFITGLRAIAVLGVFLIHSGGGGLRAMGQDLNRLVDWGKYGVEVFFVISGFTIFYQFYEKNYQFKKFLILRLCRLSIPYWPLLILVFININYGFGAPNYWAEKYTAGVVDLKNLLLHMFYLSAYDIRYQNSIIGIEWTLAVEVFYYILFGIAICIPIHQKLKHCTYFILAIALLLLSNYYADLATRQRIDNIFVLWLPVLYGYMFALGGAAYFIRKTIEEHCSKKALSYISDLFLITLSFSFVYFLREDVIIDVKFLFAILTFFSICFIRDHGLLSYALTNPLMMFLGSISFSFYLWHTLILNMPIFMIDYFVGDVFGTFLYKFALTTAISFVWYMFFEKYLYEKIKKLILAKPFFLQQPRYQLTPSR